MTARPWPQARTIVCVSAPDVPHGVGHNRVCVCNCQWCKAERAQVPVPDADHREQLLLFSEVA